MGNFRLTSFACCAYRDGEQAGVRIAALEAEGARLSEALAQSGVALEQAERSNTAHEQREVALSAELRVARAEKRAALESQ